MGVGFSGKNGPGLPEWLTALATSMLTTSATYSEDPVALFMSHVRTREGVRHHEQRGLGRFLGACFLA